MLFNREGPVRHDVSVGSGEFELVDPCSQAAEIGTGFNAVDAVGLVVAQSAGREDCSVLDDGQGHGLVG